MEYYSALKGKVILMPATTWMNLEDIMLSVNKPVSEDTHCMILLIWGIRVIKVIKTGTRILDARGYGGRGGDE